MGWTYTNRIPGTTTLEFFQREYGGAIEILEAKSYMGATYMAARNPKNPEVVFALVILTHWRAKDWFNFGYKDMDETMGPVEDNCPRSILDRLTPTDSQWANEWRARCRAKLDQARPVKGQAIRFKTPLLFTDGERADLFTLIERNTFQRADGRRVTISNWRKREYEVL